MVRPELKHIESPDLEPPALPEDPYDCEVLFQALVGPAGEDGGEIFVFSVMTPVRLSRIPDPMWGRGRLIVLQFDWSAVVKAVAELLVECAAPTWAASIAQLDRSLMWLPQKESADA